MSKSAWEYYKVLYSIYITCFVSYKISLVLPHTFQRNFFNEIFPGIILRGKSALMQESFRAEVRGSDIQEVESYLSWTCQINSHPYMKENILNLKYLDSTILTAVFV